MRNFLIFNYCIWILLVLFFNCAWLLGIAFPQHFEAFHSYWVLPLLFVLCVAYIRSFTYFMVRVFLINRDNRTVDELRNIVLPLSSRFKINLMLIFSVGIVICILQYYFLYFGPSCQLRSFWLQIAVYFYVLLFLRVIYNLSVSQLKIYYKLNS